MICMWLAVTTASNGAVKLGVSIADEEPESLPGVLEVHGEVAGQLGQPGAGPVCGSAEDVHAAGGVLNDK